MSQKRAKAEAPAEAGAVRLRVSLSSQPPRLLERLQVLPASPERDRLQSAITFLVDHWDQYGSRDQIKTHVLAHSAMVSQLESELGIDRAIVRDAARDAGTRKARGPRRPLLDAWLDEMLEKSPDMDDKRLWRAIKAGAHPQIQADGDDQILEEGVNAGLMFSGFQKRATAARKRRK